MRPPALVPTSRTAARERAPTTTESEDSNSCTGIRRTPRCRSEDQTPQRELVGRPAQQPPSRQPKRPTIMPSSRPGAVEPSTTPGDNPSSKEPPNNVATANSTKP